MGKYVRILCGMMAVLVAATALGPWQLAEAPQYVAAAESRGQAKPVSFGTDTALVPVHLESQTQEEQLVLRVLAADTEEPVPLGSCFFVAQKRRQDFLPWAGGAFRAVPAATGPHGTKTQAEGRSRRPFP